MIYFGFTGFYPVLLELTRFFFSLSPFHWVFTGFYRVLPGFTGFYRVLPGFTGFSTVFIVRNDRLEVDERRRGNRIGSCVIGSVRLSFVFLLVFFFLVVAVVLRCFFLLVGNGAVGHWSARSTAIGLKSGRNRVGNGFGFSLRIDFFRILIFTDRLR